MGHPKLIECMGICVLSLVRGSERRGSDVYLHIVKTVNWKFFFKFSQGTCPLMAFALIFVGIFLKKNQKTTTTFRGVFWANHL